MSAPLLALLHLCDSLFPLGGFAHSDGLESAASARLVRSADDLQCWLDVCLEEAIGRCDGPAVVIAWSAFHEQRWDSLIALDEELTAMRPSSTTRMASRSMGLRLLNTWHTLHPDRRLQHALALVSMRTLGPTLPVAFAGACASAGIEQRHAVEGFAYTRLAATISSAMRLIAIGQNEAHLLLSRVLARVPATVDAMMVRNAEPESFMPAIDIAQMTHQYVHSRLFRS
jgi:urease accessory protein